MLLKLDHFEISVDISSFFFLRIITEVYDTPYTQMKIGIARAFVFSFLKFFALFEFNGNFFCFDKLSFDSLRV